MTQKPNALLFLLCFSTTLCFGQDSPGLTGEFFNSFLEVGKWIQKLDDQVTTIVDKEKKEKIKRSLNYLVLDLYDFKAQNNTFRNQIQWSIDNKKEGPTPFSKKELDKLEKNLTSIGKRLTRLSAQLLDHTEQQNLQQFVEALQHSKLNRSNLFLNIRDIFSTTEVKSDDLEGLKCNADQLANTIDQSINVCFALMKKVG